MQNYEAVPVNEIQKSSCNQRFELDEANVQKLCQVLLSRNPLPAIIIRREGDHWGCIDGFHRLTAHRRANMTHIYAIKVHWTDSEAIINSHASGVNVMWTDGEKCATYSKLYKLGVNLNETKIRFGDGNKTQATIEKYIVIGSLLHPSLLLNVKSGGLNGTISLDVAGILANLDYESQANMWNNNKCTSKAVAKAAYIALKGKSPSVPETLFRRLQTHIPQSVPTPVVVQTTQESSLDIIIKQLKPAVEEYARSQNTTIEQAMSVIYRRIVMSN